MSGGHFNYDQYRINNIAGEIEELIESNDSKELDSFGCQIGQGYPPEIIDRFKEAVVVLEKAAKMAHRIDWLVSCDDGEESFLRRWKKEGLDEKK